MAAGVRRSFVARSMWEGSRARGFGVEWSVWAPVELEIVSILCFQSSCSSITVTQPAALCTRGQAVFRYHNVGGNRNERLTVALLILPMKSSLLTLTNRDYPQLSL